MAENVSSTQVIARILQEGRRRKEWEGRDETALVIKDKSKKKQVHCYKCSKVGHIKKNCQAGGGGAAEKPTANNTVKNFGFMAVEAPEVH